MSEFKKIEQKWQKKWEEAKIFEVKEDSKKKKYFVLEMFPYPSASYLHMGHVRNYTIGDLIARYKRMQGFNVLYPMGYDSFGLPAENAAKKQGIHPKKYTEDAIKKIIEYQKLLGNSYDWSRVISTHEPAYYKWNQYFFLKFLEKGLVYRKKAPVNWCPSCNSVLANEEVVDGKCWRHEDTAVVTKELEQWFLKTTAYADELLKGLDKLEWSDRLKTLQRNWIGKSEGTLAKFKLKDSKEYLEIFTTRIDTIFSVTFLVMAPEHPKARDFIKGTKYEKEGLEFIIRVSNRKDEDKSKEGFFTGKYVINPATEKEIPVYLANFVLMDYGTGIVMADAHDQRDYEFAKKYNISLIKVLKTKEGKEWTEDSAYEGYGILYNSGQFNGLTSEEAILKIRSWLEKKGLGKRITQYKLRDWLISRQRYWGTPIPIIYCDKCGTVPVKDLPVLLPEKVDFKQEGNPLNHAKEWVETKCPKCKSNARRETDTMGGFVDSSWYFLRFCSPKTDKEAFDKKKIEYWMPVDQYIGGIEHAVGHLIYSRFFTKALRDLGMIKINEPFTKLFNQGIVYKDGHKMSKSFGNIVTQTEISDKYGIDTARLFLMSVSNPESDMEWNDKGVEGSYRLLQKIIRISEMKFRKLNARDEHKRNLAIKNYTELLEQFKFNLAVIELIKFTNYREDNPNKEGYGDLLKMLSPFAPHITEELWNNIGNKGFVSLEKWPTYDNKKIDNKIEIGDEFITKTKDDVAAVLRLTKIEKARKVTLFVADSWKYNFIKELTKKMDKTRNISELIKKLMDKDHPKEISNLVPAFVKNPSKLPKDVLSQKEEIDALNDYKNKFEKQFGCQFAISNKDNGKAMPGKVAILVE